MAKSMFWMMEAIEEMVDQDEPEAHNRAQLVKRMLDSFTAVECVAAEVYLLYERLIKEKISEKGTRRVEGVSSKGNRVELPGRATSGPEESYHKQSVGCLSNDRRLFEPDSLS